MTDRRGSIIGVDHFGATVADIERSVHFWHTLLGIPITGRGIVEWPHLDELVALDNTRIEWIEFQIGREHFLELSQYHRPSGNPVPAGEENEPGRSHISLLVDDLAALLARLQRHGVRTRTASTVRLAEGSYRGSEAVYVFDPDGIELELIQRAAPRKATPLTAAASAVGSGT